MSKTFNTDTVGRIGWFVIEGLYGIKNIEETLRAGMEQTLEAIEKVVTAGASPRSS